MKSAFMFPIYLATNKIQKQIQKEDITEDRGDLDTKRGQQ